jgi:hypothetical protein
VIPSSAEIRAKSKPPWVVDLVVAINTLIALLGVIAFLCGKDIISF